MRVLLPWCSLTGTTARVAAEARAALERLGHHVTEAPIAPRWDLPYPAWLLLSFVPGSRVPIAGEFPDPRDFQGCLLALPKWTFSCPPVNAYLARYGRRLPPTAVLVTCGGWDQERYLRGLLARFWGWGVGVRGGTTIRRREVEAGAARAALDPFLARAFPAGP